MSDSAAPEFDPISTLNQLFGEETPVVEEVPTKGAEPETEPEAEEEETEADTESEAVGDGEDDEVAEADAEVGKPQSKYQKRVQTLVSRAKAAEAQLEAAKATQQSAQLDQLKSQFGASVQQVQAENARLAAQVAAMNRTKEEAAETPVDKAFKEYMVKHLSPYMQQFEADKEARAQAKLESEHRQQSDAFQRSTLAATDKHVLEGIATDQRAGISDKVAAITAAMAAAYRITPEEAAKEARSLLEAYHSARGDSKKAMVKAKISQSQKASPVASQGHVSAKNSGISNHSLEQLMAAGYDGRDAVEVFWNADRDGYKKIK